jgi:hypothetical protein
MDTTSGAVRGQTGFVAEMLEVGPEDLDEVGG